MESNSVYNLFKECIRFLMLIFIYFTTIVRIIDVYMYLYIYNFCIYNLYTIQLYMLEFKCKYFKITTTCLRYDCSL